LLKKLQNGYNTIATYALQGWTDEEIRKRYRFSRQGVCFLTDLLKEELERPIKRSHALSVEKQILIALRFYASGNFLQVIGDTLGKLILYFKILEINIKIINFTRLLLPYAITKASDFGTIGLLVISSS
jgi:hypothetical protein